METGAAAGRLLPAADLADLHLGPVGGAQHLLPRPADRHYLADYARQAEDAWRSEGAAGAERFRKELSAKEDTWVALVGPHLESLGSTPLSAEESSHLTFMRKLDWPMSRRLQDELPYVSIEFPGHPEQGRLVIQLPERLLPGGLTPGPTWSPTA